MAVLSELEPKQVFHFFEELCKIPHGTFDTKRISDYCVAFAKERGLEVAQDSANNVIIKKPGTAGYESSEPVIIQGHLDMVCEKTPGSTHDFSNDSLELYIEDGFVKAKDTTLGGDDGIAVAMAMAILDSKDIPHPPIEAVFTTDEEIGMGGAMAIDLSGLKGHMLINIDSELEGILTVGCAGGFSCYTTFPLERTAKSGTVAEIKIHGLCGGHSGIEIHKQRGNAHKMMGRLLNALNMNLELSLISIQGGSKENVISMESTAKIMIAAADADKVKEIAAGMLEDWNVEFMGDEPNLAVDVTIAEGEALVCSKASTDNVIGYFATMPNGVQGYSRKLEGLVETSLNPGIVEMTDTGLKISTLVRSSVESQKTELKERLHTLAVLTGATTEFGNEYPAWMYRPESRLRDIMVDTYQEMFGKEPEVTTIHAGLECGLFLGKKGDLDCVSFGPNILDVHSYHERLDIASVQRSFEYLKTILKKCK